MTNKIPPQRKKPKKKAASSQRSSSKTTAKASTGKFLKAKAPKATSSASQLRRFVRRATLLGILTAAWSFVGICVVVGYNFFQLPPINKITVPQRPPNMTILSVEGEVLGVRGKMQGRRVPLSTLPEYIYQAFVAIEDRRFYQHPGIDFWGIMRAFFTNVSSGSLGQGGSTLTQQLAKNLFLSPERTLSRKIQEVILSLWLEQTHTKTEILELYLNRVYYGSGAYGIDAAARIYYGKAASSLGLSEAATLAGVLKAPSSLSPHRHPQKARRRRGQVLRAMRAQGYITTPILEAALRHSTPTQRDPRKKPVNYVLDWVEESVRKQIGNFDSDLIVKTTLLSQLQKQAETILPRQIQKNAIQRKVHEGTLVSLSPDGAVRALIGGCDYAKSQFNRAVSARRQPGSAFKPFVFLAALENGLTPLSIRKDAPFSIKNWRPQNYGGAYQGDVTLKKSLAESINTIAIKLAIEVGPKTVARAAQRLGIRSPLTSDASLALGTAATTPLEMAAAYAVIANGGKRVTPYVIRQIRTRSDKILYRRTQPKPQQIIAPKTRAMLDEMLREVMNSGTGRAGRIKNWRLAGKTGTSQRSRDAWFIGYSPDLVTAVWVGNDDGTPMLAVTGAGLPLRIWREFMAISLPTVTEKRPLPPNLAEIPTPLSSRP